MRQRKERGKEEDDMSKLSPKLKALINAPFARPNTLPASPRIRGVYEESRREAREKDVGVPAWLAVSVSFGGFFICSRWVKVE